MPTARITLSAPVAATLLCAALGCSPTLPPSPAPDEALAQAIEIGDTDAALNLIDDELTWTDAEGRTLGRSEMARMLPKPAIEEEGGAEVRHFDYGRVEVVRIDRGALHALRVWVRRPAGWRLLVYQEVRSLAAPPTATPGTGKECVNPCRTVPYEPATPNERGVIAAYQALETAAHAADAANWPRYVADEFVLVSSNSDRTFDKQARLAGLRKATYGGVSPTELLSASLFDFDTVVVMRSQHRPDRGDPLQITRVWVNRNGAWMSTLSYQTSIRAAAAIR